MDQDKPIVDPRRAYLNGAFVTVDKAHISALDRGFVFGDGVYEVIPVYHKKLFHLEAHIERLNQSLKGIRMLPPLTLTEWQQVLEKLIEQNNDEYQWIYLQITRGVDFVRSHEFPTNNTPTVFATSFPKPLLSKAEQSKGVKIMAVTDIRWKYCHIKTISRLAYVLMYQEAKEAGFDEAIIFNNGFALECTTSNIFIIRHGVIITPPKSQQILSGITRDCVLTLAEKNKIPYRQTKITERDVTKADEVWITSSTRGIHPVIDYNGTPVGKGEAGPVWERMWDLFQQEIESVKNVSSTSIPL
jgi:D-alanine transaminase